MSASPKSVFCLLFDASGHRAKSPVCPIGTNAGHPVWPARAFAGLTARQPGAPRRHGQRLRAPPVAETARIELTRCVSSCGSSGRRLARRPPRICTICKNACCPQGNCRPFEWTASAFAEATLALPRCRQSRAPQESANRPAAVTSGCRMLLQKLHVVWGAGAAAGQAQKCVAAASGYGSAAGRRPAPQAQEAPRPQAPRPQGAKKGRALALPFPLSSILILYLYLNYLTARLPRRSSPDCAADHSVSSGGGVHRRERGHLTVRQATAFCRAVVCTAGKGAT